MITRAEELPTEIWMMTFEYIELHDLFNSFYNMNSHFNHILNSTHLLFYVRMNDIYRKSTNTNGNHFHWNDPILNRIVCLQANTRSNSNFVVEFLYWNSIKLIRLRSLSCRILSTQTQHICEVLSELKTLENLSLVCFPNEILLKSILAIPTLRICLLTFRSSSVSLNQYDLTVRSNIRKLIMIYISHINGSLIDFILAHVPKLKRLEVSGSCFSFDRICILDRTSHRLLEMKIFKIKLDSGSLTSDCFKTLATAFPALKSFCLYYEKHILSMTFMDDFITFWWSYISHIKHIYINIRGHIFIDPTDGSVQNSFQNIRRQMLDNSISSMSSCHFNWVEKDLNRLRLFDITIIRS